MNGIVELCEIYLGCKSRLRKKVKHKREKGIEKQAVMVIVERQVRFAERSHTMMRTPSFGLKLKVLHRITRT